MLKNVFFILCPSRVLLKYIKIKVLTICLYLISRFFKKQKEVCNLPPCLIFCMIFKEKYFSRFILLVDQISLPDCLYFLIIICCSVCEVINFKINFGFLIKPVFYITKTSRQKCKYLKNKKSF